MTTTPVATSAYRTAVPAPRPCSRWIFLVAVLLCGATAHAENVLQDITSAALPGGKVEVTMTFAEPVAAPRVFSTESPPSVALDFADTRNAVAKRHIDINAGATSGASVVAADGRTRVVVDMFRVAGYDTRVNGNKVVLSVNNGLIGTTAVASAVGRTDPTKRISTAGAIELTNVDFRRGADGQGRVVVSFNGPGAAASLKREGGKMVVDFLNVSLPPQQAKRLDVLDFATPVQSIDTRPQGSGVRMEIDAKTPYEQSAYQTANEYVVEVAPKKEAPKQTGKNAVPVYSGSRVTFNFQDIPTRSVLQLIADVSNINIVVADSVQGNVTLRLVNVPWDQALDIVLQAKGLDKRKQGNVIWVAPQKEIADREQAIADASQKKEDTESLVSDYIPISYGKAKDIAALLTKDTQTNQAGGQQQQQNTQRGFLSSRGSVTYDDRTNTLLVSDIPAKVQEIRQLVAVLDRPVRQVLIESRIVIANDTFARELGVQFGVSGAYQDSNNNIVSTSGSAAATDAMNNVALRNRLSGTSRGLPASAAGPVGAGILVPDLANRLNVNMPATNPAGSFGLAILGADYLLDLELSAAQTEGRSETISSPRVITANQKEADIKQGIEIGYLQYSAGAGGGGIATIPTVAFKDANLELKVTPTITADDRINLDLDVKKDDVAGTVDIPGGGSVPTLNRREVATAVLVDNGQTVVLGGVAENVKSDTVKKVPILGDVPVLGNLFKNTNRNDEKRELLIFVTPRILDDTTK